MRTLLLAVVLATLVVGGSPVAGVAVATPSEDAPLEADELTAPVGAGPAATDGGDIELTQRLSLTPNRPGEIDVTLHFRIPDRVASLTTQVPKSATVVGSAGFTAVNATHYEWDGETNPATITYHYPVNETEQTTGPGYALASERTSGTDASEPDAQTASDAGYLFVDTGEWALVSRPSAALTWSYRGEQVSVTRTTTVVGDGAAGERIAYLGDHRTVTRTANGQQFRFVIPGTASLRESPDDVLDALAWASETMAVGDRDDHVFMVAAPDENVDWAVRGLQTADADFWVEASESLNRTNSAWFHEYVHTRQGYTAGTRVKWFTEGGATYYATLLALESKRIPFEEFSAFLAIGHKQYGEAVLTDPDEWKGSGNYYKGALVAGELDRRIRLATDGAKTYQTVFQEMNSHRGQVGYADWLAFVKAAGNETVKNWAGTYTQTDAYPTVWSRQQHREAFGQLPARLVYGFAPTDPLAVDGPYRTTTLATTSPTVVTGETVTVRTRVENTGGTATTYNATLWLDDRLLSSSVGSIDAGEARTFETNHTFAQTGTYTLQTGTETIDLSVVEPAAIQVDDLRVNRTTLRGPGTVAVSATVGNDASIPARGTVTFTLDGAAVATHDVTLAPEANATVSTTVHLPAPGDYRVGVANGETRQVTVEATPTPTPTPTPEPTTARETADGDVTTGVGPGFGVVAALLGAVALGLLSRRR